MYPSIGNHDADESEDCDDRAQVEDNFYICERMAGEEAAGRASFGPGLFYRFRYGADIEFVCLDTSKEGFFKGHRLFEFPKHWTFVEASFPRRPTEPRGTPRWRIPFTHHPPFSAGPRHHNTKEMAQADPALRAVRRESRCSAGTSTTSSTRGPTASTISSPEPPAKSAMRAPNGFDAGAHAVVERSVPFPAGAHPERQNAGAGHRRDACAGGSARGHRTAGPGRPACRRTDGNQSLNWSRQVSELANPRDHGVARIASARR